MRIDEEAMTEMTIAKANERLAEELGRKARMPEPDISEIDGDSFSTEIEGEIALEDGLTLAYEALLEGHCEADWQMLDGAEYDLGSECVTYTVTLIDIHFHRDYEECPISEGDKECMLNFING